MNLNVLQDGFRLPYSEMWDMRRFAQDGYFNKEALLKHDPQHTSLIAIVRTEDEKLWIRDGLHRVAMVYAAGRDLREDEYTIEDIPYSKFMEINLQKGWFTPFDPRFEVRRANFHDFKSTVQQFVEDGVDPFCYIIGHPKDYRVPREIHHTLGAYCKMWCDSNR